MGTFASPFDARALETAVQRLAATTVAGRLCALQAAKLKHFCALCRMGSLPLVEASVPRVLFLPPVWAYRRYSCNTIIAKKSISWADNHQHATSTD